MKKILLMAAAILMAGCAKMPTHTTISDYFSKTEKAERVSPQDVKRAKQIFSNFADRASYGYSKIDLRNPSLTGDFKKDTILNQWEYIYEAEFIDGNTLFIRRVDPSTEYSNQGLEEFERPRHEFAVVFNNSGFMEILVGDELRKKRNDCWIYMLIDEQTGGIIKYSQKDRTTDKYFGKNKLEMEKDGTIKVDIEYVEKSAYRQFYEILEMMEDVQKKISER